MQVITQIEVEETVKRIVKCDPGFRYPSDEEWANRSQGLPKGTEFMSGENNWCCYCTYNGTGPRHHYRIKLEPEIFTHTDGKRYEVVTDPARRVEKGDLYYCNRGGWEPANGVIGKTFEKLVSWNIHTRVARPLEQVYEGEVSAHGYMAAVFLPPTEFKHGQRVRVEVVG